MNDVRGASLGRPLDAYSPKPGRAIGNGLTAGGLVIGIILAAIAAYQLFGTGLVAAHEQSNLKHSFQNRIVPARLGSSVARLEVPRLGMDLIVVEGIGMKQLAMGPGHYPHTVPIGTPGVSAIAGHSSGWGAPFMRIGRLQPGDLIIVKARGKTFRYRVMNTFVVEPNAMWVLQGNPSSPAKMQLVLTTCWPVFTNKHRLILWADLISPN
jgi:sortase A